MNRVIAVLIIAGSCLCGSAALAQDDESKSSTASSADARPTVDLQSLLETVSETSGKNFLVHPIVPARIVVGGTGIDDPGYPLLLSILRNNGLAAVEIEGHVNIMPDDPIRQQPLPIVQRDEADIPDDAWVTRVIPVSSGNAHQLVPILRPLIAQQGHLSASGQDQGNKLFIVATYAKVKQITELVKRLSE